MSSSVRNSASTGGAEDEIARLRADVSRLEAQLAETEAWANRAVAAAQVKTYWLDRWGVDLNAVMERPIADRVRASARGLRFLVRLVKRCRRRLSS